MKIDRISFNKRPNFVLSSINTYRDASNLVNFENKLNQQLNYRAVLSFRSKCRSLRKVDLFELNVFQLTLQSHADSNRLKSGLSPLLTNFHSEQGGAKARCLLWYHASEVIQLAAFYIVERG